MAISPIIQYTTHTFTSTFTPQKTLKELKNLALTLQEQINNSDIEHAKASARLLVQEGRLLIAEVILQDNHEDPLPIALILSSALSSAEIQWQDELKHQLAKACRIFIELSYYKASVQKRTIYQPTKQSIQKALGPVHSNTRETEVALRFELDCCMQALEMIETNEPMMLNFCINLFSLIKNQETGQGISMIKEAYARLVKSWFPTVFYISWLGSLCSKSPQIFEEVKNEIAANLNTKQVALCAVDLFAELTWLGSTDLQEKAFFGNTGTNSVSLLGLASLKRSSLLPNNALWTVRYFAVQHLALLTEHPNKVISQKAQDALLKRRIEETDKEVRSLLDTLAKNPRIKEQWSHLFAKEAPAYWSDKSKEEDHIKAEKALLKQQLKELEEKMQQLTLEKKLADTKEASITKSILSLQNQLAEKTAVKAAKEKELQQLEKEQVFIVQEISQGKRKESDALEKQAVINQKNEELILLQQEMDTSEILLGKRKTNLEQENANLKKSLADKNQALMVQEQELKEKKNQLKEREDEFEIIAKNLEDLKLSFTEAKLAFDAMVDELIPVQPPIQEEEEEGISYHLLLCPISLELMKDPVVAADGNTYERTEIETWFTKNDRSPLTNIPIEKSLTSNFVIKQAIADYKEKKQSKSNLRTPFTPLVSNTGLEKGISTPLDRQQRTTQQSDPLNVSSSSDTNAKKLNPNNAEALAKRGEVYRSQGKYDLALTNDRGPISSSSSSVLFSTGATYEYSNQLASLDNLPVSSQKLKKLLEAAHHILNGKTSDAENAKRAIHELLLQGRLSLVQDIFKDQQINPLEIAYKLLVVAKTCDTQKDPLIKSEKEPMLKYELVKASRILIESSFSRDLVQNGSIYTRIKTLIEEIHSTTVPNDVGLNFELECIGQLIKIIETNDRSSIDFFHSLFKAIKTQDFILGFNAFKCFFPTQSTSKLSSNWYLLVLYFSWMGALCAKDTKKFAMLRPQMISYLHHEHIAISVIDTLAELIWTADPEIQEKSFYRGNELCLLDLANLKFKCTFTLNRSWQISYQLLQHLAQLTQHPISRISSEAADALRERQQDETNGQLKALLDATAPAVQLKAKKNPEKSAASIPSSSELTKEVKESEDTQVSALEEATGKLIEEKKYDEALAILNNALKNDPHNHVALALRGNVHYLKKDYNTALKDLNQSLVLNPDHRKAIFMRIAVKIDLKQEKEAFEEVDRYLQRFKDSLKGLIRYFSSRKKYFEALLILNHLIQKNPNHFEALYERAMIYYKDSQKNPALMDLKRCLELRPDDLSTLRQRSSVFIDLNLHEEALKDLNRWLVLAPKDSFRDIIVYIMSRQDRGSLYVRLKKYKEALEDFSVVIDERKRLVAKGGRLDARIYLERAEIYSKLNEYTKAAQDLKEASKIEKDKEQKLEIYLQLADTYSQLKKYPERIEALTEAVNLDPKNSSVLESRAECYLDNEDYNEAMKDLQAVIEIKPTYSAHRIRGYLYFKKKQYNRAKKELLSSIAIKESSTTYALLGRVCVSLEEFKEAQDHFTQSIELDGKNEEAFTNRGVVYLALGKRKEAMEDLSKSIEIEPTYTALVSRADLYRKEDELYAAARDLKAALKIEKTAEAHEKLGEIYRLRGEYDDAVEQFDHCLAFDDENSAALESRGAAHFKLKNYKQSKEDLDRAIKLNPKSHFALKIRADWFLQFDELRKALADIQEALDLDYSAGSLVRRGKIYYFLKKHKEAYTDFENAIKLDPENEEAKECLKLLLKELKR